MARPVIRRYVSCEPRVSYFEPQGAGDAEETNISVEGLEALRLVHLAELSLDDAAGRMRVSRHTFGRILAQAQKSVTEALVYGRKLKISGGSYIVEEEPDLLPDREIARIAVTASGPALDGMVDPRFGRAEGFLLINLPDMSCEYVANNTQHFNAGVEAAQVIKNAGAEALLSGHVGSKAHEALEEAGIFICQNMGNMTVREAVEIFIKERVL